MSSKYEEMKAASKQNLQEASDAPTMVYVPDSNWQAVISQLKLLSNLAIETKAKVDATMTFKDMTMRLENQQTIFDQVLEKSEEIQKQTSEITTLEISKLNQAAKDLSSQAGKLNEQTLSQLKCSDEQNRKLGFRLLRLVVLIEFLHLISSVALLLWLR